MTNPDRPQLELDRLIDQIHSKRELIQMGKYAHIHRMSLIEALTNRIQIKKDLANQHSPKNSIESRHK